MYELLVLLMLNVIVLVHEMGHYITAKILHIQPKTFAIGFWKTIWEYKGRDGVVYKINLLPFGGYVNFDMEKFQNEKPYKKFLVLFSGIFFNLLLAIVISFGFVVIAKMPLDYTNTSAPSLPWNFGTAIIYTAQSVTNTFDLIIKSLQELFLNPNINSIMGPIQTIKEGSNILKQNFLLFMPLFVLLDINILILNAIPLPALDGGRMIFAVVEMLTRKRVKWEENIHLAGFMFLMLFMIIIFGKDIFMIFFK